MTLVAATRRAAAGLALVLAGLLAVPVTALAEDPPAPPPPPPATDPAPPPAPPPVPAAPESPVRIGLGRALTAAEVKAPGGLVVVGDGAVQLQSAPGEVVRLVLVNGRIEVAALAGKQFASVRLVPVATATPAPDPGSTTPPPAPANPVTYNGKTYRGEMEVLVTPAGKLSAINVVNLEEYLLGVVPGEMPASWPMEALKAQAVAARSYARRNLGGYAPEGFDMVDTTASQAYGGLGAERTATSTAVWNTRGQVVTYNGQIIPTYYHSSSGGHTENNEIIWSGPPLPYLRGVPDSDNLPGNLRYEWRFTFTPEEFGNKLVTYNAKYDLGIVTGVAASGVIGASGRPSLWQVEGTKGKSALTAEGIRWALGLPSSPTLIKSLGSKLANAIRSWTSGETVAVIGPGGQVTQRAVGGTVVVGAGGTPVTLGTTSVTAMGGIATQAGGYEVLGGGYGHAIGMSQWGAHGMALVGKTYVEILTHYYQGTKVETR